MSNYTKENLIAIPPTAVPAGTLAMKVGNEIFTPGNIRISSGGSMDFYKCASVDTTSKTWSGYLAVIDEETEIWSFATEATSGLIYGVNVVPQVGMIYNNPATISASLYQGFRTGALFAIDASVGLNDIINNVSPTTVGTGTVLSDGEFCFDAVRGLEYPSNDSLSGLADFTIEMDFTITGTASGYAGFVSNHTGWGDGAFLVQWLRLGNFPSLHWYDGIGENGFGDDYSAFINDGKYHHIAIVRGGTTVLGFLDGKMYILGYTSAKLNFNAVGSFWIGYNMVDRAYLPGRCKHFRIVPSALYTSDFSTPAWVGA